MRLKFSELQESDYKTWKIKAKGLKNIHKKVDGVLHYQGLSFIPEIIQIKLISWYHNNLLEGYFSINKIRELIGRKYYWPSLKEDAKAYIKGGDICLRSKTIKHKLYGDL